MANRSVKAVTFTPDQIIGSVYATFRNGGYGFEKGEIENFVWEIEEDLSGVNKAFEELADGASTVNVDAAAEADDKFIKDSSKAFEEEYHNFTQNIAKRIAELLNERSGTYQAIVDKG